jgi:arylsulfatase A-like enzyme
MDYAPPAPFDTLFDPDYRGTADGTHEWVKPYIAAAQPHPRTIDPRDRKHMEALYDEEILYVPLIMRLPQRSRAGEVVDDLVTLLDIGSTLLAAAGVDRPSSFEGRNLLVEPISDSNSQHVFAESDRFKVRRRAVRGPRFKLVHTVDVGGREIGVQVREGYELFDLQADSGGRPICTPRPIRLDGCWRNLFSIGPPAGALTRHPHPS